MRKKLQFYVLALSVNSENIESDLFEALWYKVEGDLMIDKFGGHPLQLSQAPGTEYIPTDYAGTITAPNYQPLKEADKNNVLYTAAGTPKNLTISQFVDNDMERIPVLYGDPDYYQTYPYNVYKIGLLKKDIILTQSQLDWLHANWKLWIFWSGWNGYGIIKNNRSWT